MGLLPQPRATENAQLERCLRYAYLKGRRDELGLPLLPEDADWLAALEAELASCAAALDHPLPFLGRLDVRHPVGVPVAFADAAGRTFDGVVRDVSAGGLFVTSSRALPRGERASFRYVDDAAGRGWLFGAEVAWACAGREPGMGLRIVGIPMELRVGSTAAAGRPWSVAA